MYFFAVFSLFISLITIIAPQVLNILPILSSSSELTDIQAYNALFCIQPCDTTINRNYGFAWEPGAFALLLCLAIYCQIVFYKTLPIKRVIIMSTAVFTTFSTMGYVVLLGMLMVLLCSNLQRPIYRIGLLLFIVTIIVIAYNLPQDTFDLVFGKISDVSINEADNMETTQARINAIVFPGIAFIEHPLIGVGYDNFSVINSTICNNVATNTIVNWFAIGGCLLGLPLLYYYCRWVYYSAKRFGVKTPFIILLCVLFIMLVSTESLLRISLIYIIVFYGCQFHKTLNNK